MVGRSKVIARVCAGIAAGCMLGLFALESPASAAGILEDFEGADNPEGGYPLDWEVIQERIELGETTLAGCPSYDGVSYSNLDDIVDNGRLFGPQGSEVPSFGTAGDFNNVPDRHSEYGYYVKWFPPSGAPQYQVDAPSGPLVWWDSFWGGYGFGPDSDSEPIDFSQLSFSEKEELLDLQANTFRDKQENPIRAQYEDEYDVTILDGTGYGIGWTSQVLQLYSYTDSYGGHVIHGPAVVSSDTLKVTGEAQLKFSFSASADMDYYHVFGYLQKVGDCVATPIVLFSDSGESSSWDEVVVNDIPTGEYKFVFVSGTYDYTWGQIGGALLWIDDITCSGEVEAPTGSDTCDVTQCQGDCGDVEGTGVDEIVLLPEDEEHGYDGVDAPGWIVEALAGQAREQLPETGSTSNQVPLAVALVLLGSGLLVLRRRRTFIGSVVD